MTDRYTYKTYSTAKFYIPAGLYFPVVNSVGMVCNDLIIENNATVTINPDKILTILGNLILNAGN